LEVHNLRRLEAREFALSENHAIVPPQLPALSECYRLVFVDGLFQAAQIHAA